MIYRSPMYNKTKKSRKSKNYVKNLVGDSKVGQIGG